MSSAWLLPEHIADVLPSQARHIEELRRRLLDAAAAYGFELVMPPLLEHLESLLSGTGRELNLQTFKLVDQLSGRTLGLRADSTPQVARIDAHLLNRAGVARLCYCGPVLHTRPAGIHASREPLQFGAEIYGHAGLEADLEIQDLALECLQGAGVGEITLDLGDVRILRELLGSEEANGSSERIENLLAALAAKDVSGLQDATAHLPAESARSVRQLVELYGGIEVIAEARRCLPDRPAIRAALDELESLAGHARTAHPEIAIGCDLADTGGFAYYSGPRFAVYARGWSDAIARGGRYDEVGAVFGRNRPAVGFSLDLKDLAALVPGAGTRTAIRAPWSEESGLRSAIRRLREQGETVICVLPGHDHRVEEFECDRELVAVGSAWAVRAL